MMTDDRQTVDHDNLAVDHHSDISNPAPNAEFGFLLALEQRRPW